MKRLTLALIAVLAFGAFAARAAEPVSYLDWDDANGKMTNAVCTTYEEYTGQTEFEDGKWYVVAGNVVIDNGSNIKVNGSAHLILCDNASLTITNVATDTAAIDVSVSGSTTNSLAIYGQQGGSGVLSATGGNFGAGIGTAERSETAEGCGAIVINGGTVTAMGGNSGAGIGGGYQNAGGNVTITGGRVTAIGRDGAKGIGGGGTAGGGTVYVAGGTVDADGWKGQGLGGTVTVDGGSVKTKSYESQPKNGVGSPLYCVTVKLSEERGGLRLEGLGGYGTNDICEVEGKVYLWLPDGTHNFTLSDGTTTLRYCAVVKGRAITVEPLPVGFFVNGVDIGEKNVGRGWFYFQGTTLLLDGVGPFVLSGVATNNEVQIQVKPEANGATVVLSNAVVFTENRQALDVKVTGSASLLMAGGTSYLAATNNAAAVSVGTGSALAVGLEPGADASESMIGVFNYGDAKAISGSGTVAVNGGTLAVWADEQAVEAPGTFTCGTGEVMMTGETPETLRYVGVCDINSCVLVGPGVTVTVKDIPHVTDFTVSNAVQEIDGAPVEGGSAYRVLPGDDVFVGYTLEEDYFSRSANPLVYTNVTNDITVDADAIPIMPPVPYRAWNEETQQMEDRVCTDYEVVTSDTAAFESNTWYVVTNAVSRGMITVSGNAHLILCDNASLTITNVANYNAAIDVSVSGSATNSLAIYGQQGGSGVLTATGGNFGAGIGGGYQGAGGTVTVNGGTVTATGALGAAGIGGGYECAGGTVTINGGVLTATGGNFGAGIGGGNKGAGGTVTINGGVVSATGGNSGAGIGGGDSGAGGTVTVSGGIVTATGGDSGAGIGGGYQGAGGTVTINGGEVAATGDVQGGAGIGGGWLGAGGTVTINGGSLTATGGEDGAGIGGGALGDHGTVTFGAGAWLVLAGISAPGEEVSAASYADDHSARYVCIEPSLKPPLSLKIPAGTHYSYVVSNETTGAVLEGVSADGTNTYAVKNGSTVKVYFTPEERYELDKTEYAFAKPIDEDCSIPAEDMPTATYLYAVITVGQLNHMTAAWTSGDGTVTNAINGTTFEVLKGTTGLKVIFTPEERYELDKTEYAFAKPIDEDCSIPAEDMPTATYLYAVITVGQLNHMTAAWTSGDGTVTNAIEGMSFEVLKGTTGLKVIFTLDQNCRFVNGGETGVRALDSPLAEGCEVTPPETEGIPGTVVNPWVVGTDVRAYMGDEGTLVITGTGAMDDFASAASVPWTAVAGEVTAVTVADGVTYIGENAFAGLANTVTVNGRTVFSLKLVFGPSEPTPVPVPPAGAVTSWDALTNAVATAASGAVIAVGADITEEGGELVVPKDREVVIKLYGKVVSCRCVTVVGVLTVGDADDSVGRIVASDGAKISRTGSVTLLCGPIRGTFTSQTPGLMLMFK